MGFSMSIVTPQGRKHLSADALFRLVQSGFASLPDHRVGETEIALTDALMSAFAMFFLKAPSLLAFDKERAEGNLHAIYGIERVPCDTHMREILQDHFFCDCVPSNQVFSHHWGQVRLKDEMGLLSTRQPVMSNRESLCKRREKGWSNHSLSCPLPWSPRIHVIVHVVKRYLRSEISLA
jgi:hypothetical protein